MSHTFTSHVTHVTEHKIYLEESCHILHTRMSHDTYRCDVYMYMLHTHVCMYVYTHVCMYVTYRTHTLVTFTCYTHMHVTYTWYIHNITYTNES